MFAERGPEQGRDGHDRGVHTLPYTISLSFVEGCTLYSSAAGAHL